MAKFRRKRFSDDKKNESYVLTYRQDELRWRRLLFLPFNFYWRLATSIGGCIYFSMVIYEKIFMRDGWSGVSGKTFSYILGTITSLLVVDFILSILHKCWITVQKAMPYQPKSGYILIVDVISIIPVNLVMKEPFLSSDGTIVWPVILSLNGCVRIYRIFLELIRLQQRMGMNPILLCFIQQNCLVLCIASLLCSIWYILGFINSRPNTSRGSWMDHIADTKLNIDVTSSYVMYFFTLQQVFVMLSNELIADVRTSNPYESLFRTVCFFIGFAIKTSYMVGNMITSCLKYQGHLFEIKDHIKINTKCLKGEKRKLKTYYNTFWDNWLGLHKAPLMDHFPLCLRRDVLTDLYCDAIAHSHILRHFQDNIKRHISLVMESKFMQPGDHIFRKGHVKTKYYYIATGVVQIMSHYDGISPIMTISSGSCLGGFALTLPAPSPTDVICATICEVRVLSYKNLHNVLKNYPTSANILLKIEREHISHMKKMYVLSRKHRKYDPLMILYGVPQDDKLKWIKQRWRAINQVEMTIIELVDKNAQKKLIDDLLPIEMTHTSKYLDIIVLSSEAKWDADKCCIRSRCPYVLDPNCNFVKVWLVFIVVLITIDCILLPYYSAFAAETSELFVKWDNIICFAYICDIYFQAITAVRKIEGTLITEPMRVFRYHLKTISFLIDIIATIPVREVARFFISNEEFPRYLALHRLLKVVRVYAYFKYRDKLIMVDRLTNRILKYIYCYFLLMYFAACFTFMMACYFKKGKLVCHTDSWYYLDSRILELAVDRKVFDLYIHQFMHAIYYVTRFVLETGLKASPPVILYDLVAESLLLFLSGNLYVFVLAELIAIWNMKRKRRLMCKELVILLKSVLEQKKTHPGLSNMVESFIYVQWKINLGIELNLSTHSTSEIVSPLLRRETERKIYKCLETVEFFNVLDEQTYDKVAKKFRILTVPANFIFCRSGEQPPSFNILLKGFCNLTSMLKEDLLANPYGKTVGPGANFPLMEVLQNIPCLQTTVSLTVCEVATIEVTSLRKMIFRDEYILKSISTSTTVYISQLDVIISKKKYRKVEEKSPNYLPRRYRKKKPTDSKIYSNSKILFLKFLHNLWNPPFIINPSGRFLFIWETFKVIQVIITVLYIPAMFMLMCPNGFLNYLLAIALDVFSLLDVLLRFNVGHYNTNGVVVNDKVYYLSHSFGIDFTSALPIYLLISEYNFRTQFYSTIIIKSFQIYRIAGYSQAFRKRFDIDNFILFAIVFVTHMFLMTIVVSTCLLAHACTVVCSENEQILKCRARTWIGYSTQYKLDRSPFSVVANAFNLILVIFTGCDQGTFFAQSDEEMRTFVFLSIISYVVRLYYIPKAASYMIGAHANFTLHRDNLRGYRAFVRNEGGDRAVASKIINHFNLQYNKLKGLNVNQFVRTLHPSLQSDLTFALYYKGFLILHRFIGESRSFMKLLSNKVEESYYLTDTIIINLNQVNGTIFFVREGLINVFDAGNEYVRTLATGSMFGSFKSSKNTRHAFKFVTQYHTNLLSISSTDFYTYLGAYDVSIKQDFMEKTKTVEFVSYSQMSESIQELIVTEGTSFLDTNSGLYLWAMYFLSMIFPYFSMFPLLFCIIMGESKDRLIFLVVIYIFDFLSCFRIYIGLQATQKNELGVQVLDMKHLRKQYLISPTEFPLDVLSVLPFELIGFAVKKKIFGFLLFNRLLKIIMIYKYAINHTEKTYVRTYLRWSEFLILLTLTPYVFICLWMYVTCDHGCNLYKEGRKVTITNPYRKFIYSAYEVISVYTFSMSFELKKPIDTTECIMIIIYSLLVFTFLPALLASFAQTLSMSNYLKKIYEYEIYCMKIYLQLRDLSKSLLELIWNYSLLLWKTNRGVSLPLYVEIAPYNLKCELLFDLYGAHLQFNILFEDCPYDFIIQLSGRLDRKVYFPGDFIIRKFDFDGRMYFINSGEIETVELTDLNSEVVKEVYITGQCFGLSQGLYERSCHMITYKARNMVEVLSLKKSNWEDLLDAFPECGKKIYYTARKLELDDFQ